MSPAIRPPRYAGRFYPSDTAACRREAEALLAGAASQVARGAVTPHAGWIYSGSAAAKAIAAIADGKPETVIIFGAVHSAVSHDAAVYPTGAWETPLGTVAVDEQLATLLAKVRGVATDARAHSYEHSIEVELPLLICAAPGVRIVPLMVNFGPAAARVGREVADAAERSGRRVAFLASTDLTHYGPAFGFEPAGRGPRGFRWAKDVNDRRFIHRIAAVDADGIVPEAERHHNACGAGAVAALLGAMQALGATTYTELEHTTSAEVKGAAESDALNSVGYEAGIFV